jgi:hypothetical protein
VEHDHYSLLDSLWKHFPIKTLSVEVIVDIAGTLSRRSHLLANAIMDYSVFLVVGIQEHSRYHEVWKQTCEVSAMPVLDVFSMFDSNSKFDRAVKCSRQVLGLRGDVDGR